MVHDLRAALADRILVADGAMGTMLQGYDLALADFQGYEGCNEILNVTRPDVVAAIHRAYLDAGSDCIETNTFGANLAALGEYDIPDRIAELAGAGARIARETADQAARDGRPRFVLGSVGPGTKLPSLGHVGYTALRDAYQVQAEAMIAGGVDAVQIETCQDLLQTKAAVVGAHRAARALGVDLPVLVNVTIETSGTMLLGSEIGAALTALEPLGIDALGLNCGTGPTEMSEHLRHLSRHARIPVTCMPNAGLPELTPDGARYPMGPDAFTGFVKQFTTEFGLGLVGGCCGTTPAHIARLAQAVAATTPAERTPSRIASVSSLYTDVPLHQETSYLSIGERTNANG
ncbi:MAG: homocysteine S-methyltransferase family protein, partial [Propionicimonas sp.]|nr:homocysteine S-methyltransferase family protein [Propionicimonas sp.]